CSSTLKAPPSSTSWPALLPSSNVAPELHFELIPTYRLRHIPIFQPVCTSTSLECLSEKHGGFISGQHRKSICALRALVFTSDRRLPRLRHFLSQWSVSRS